VALTFTDEQDELRAAVRGFLADKSPTGEVRRWIETDEGHDPALWRRMADELGLQGIAVPEELGGAGAGPVELAIVLEETGRALLPGPFLACVLAGQALLAAGDPAARERWVPALAEGALVATLSPGQPGAPGRLRATEGADGWMLDGTRSAVVAGDTAQLLLLVAETPAGPGLFAVDTREAVGGELVRTPVPVVDRTRRLADLALRGVPAVAVGPRPGAPEATVVVRAVTDLALVGLAAEQLGGAQACLDLSVEYAKVREQFGRPIGSFQAIKHKCADMLLEVEGSRAAVYHAAGAAVDHLAGAADGELEVAAALAAGYVSAAYVYAAKETIQIHGGIGYTWEHDAHLYLKRATSSELLLGTSGAHRARLAGLIGIGGGAA
jgi:alkylation response protein AidB-like acyl-CoA dehydrogenase